MFKYLILKHDELFASLPLTSRLFSIKLPPLASVISINSHPSLLSVDLVTCIHPKIRSCSLLTNPLPSYPHLSFTSYPHSLLTTKASCDVFPSTPFTPPTPPFFFFKGKQNTIRETTCPGNVARRLSRNVCYLPVPRSDEKTVFAQISHPWLHPISI